MIADCLKRKEFFLKALTEYKILVERQGLILGCNHQSTFKTQMSILHILCDCIKFEECIDYYTRLINEKTVAMGKLHNQVFSLRKFLMDHARDNMNHAKAIKMLKAEIEIQSTYLGLYH